MADGTRSRVRRRRLAAGRDRLSALPDDLLHHTITYLPVTEAIATAALSSSWRHIWRSYPLVLKDADIPEPARDALVPRVLAEHPGSFRSVILYDCRLASLNRELPGWPRLLVDKRTQQLLLAHPHRNLPAPPPSTVNQPDAARLLPADILRSGSLQDLSLDFWTFSADLCRRADINLPQLRILTLTRVVISDQDLECLIAVCPVLESLGLGLTLNNAKHVRLRSKSLRCALVVDGRSKDGEFTVVDTPLLQRLYLLQQFKGVALAVRIACAPKLRVLGYLDTRTHKLQIGDSVIRPDTMASARTVVPTVEILALAVNLGISGEVKMLASFLRCFPNVETLHIESAPHYPSVTASEPSGEHHARFYQEVSQVDCLRSHAKKLVIHDFRGDQNEFEFVKFIAMNAQELQSLLVVVSDQEILSSADKVNEIKEELQCVQFPTGISAVLHELPKAAVVYRLKRAADLTINDPFEC
ncbi:FBD-associated F-box protein At2g26860-like [Hordeum vulgare subsp. vulgare]|uniref:Predicted protein n=1 Tax=Hordeum vulgare subsp. vulgare TaxID=112509 RepID=F2EJK9_HORVV|nr:FBD-associated F-box protein At2g26860-like [Hordeum vulgare subsp. vulgare]KAI4971389.1 hypothetical protein ZWY2020_002303 [Hordeum vulgare]BAK07531.1 predicted protein [Hordeum vulgare subsp. vulgare]